MRFGIMRQVAGNIEALAAIDRQFTAAKVDSRICLGDVVGIYPFVPEVVEFLDRQNYCVLTNDTDRTFVTCGPYDGWATTLMVEVLQYVRPRTSEATISFLRESPSEVVLNGWRFTSRLPIKNGFVNYEGDAKAAFATCGELIVFHGSDMEARIWHESGKQEALTPGQRSIDMNERLLVSPGGIGSKYWGPECGLGAIVFDDQTMSIEVLRAGFDTEVLLTKLRGTEFPKRPLDYLTQNEYRG